MGSILRSSIAFLILAPLLCAASKCTKNACYNAVDAEYTAVNKPAADLCHNFLAKTIMPQPVTTTVTGTTTRTNTVVSTTVVPATSVITFPATASTAATLTDVSTTVDVIKRSTGSCPAPSAASTNTVPAYASACKNGAALSSACSCVGITAGHTTTLPACTSTIRATVTAHTTKTVIVTIPSDVATSDFTTIVATRTSAIATTTTTTTSYSFSPVCTSVSDQFFGGTWNLFYSGAGFSENTTIPGNNVLNGYWTFNGNVDPCQAVQDCYENVDIASAKSFDVHYLKSISAWRCRGFPATQSSADGAYFNVANDDVAMAYGFTYS